MIARSKSSKAYQDWVVNQDRVDPDLLIALIAAMEGHSSLDDPSLVLTIVEVHAYSLLLETFLFALYVILMVYLVCRPCGARQGHALPRLLKFFTSSMFILYLVYWALDVHLLRMGYLTLRLSSVKRHSHVGRHLDRVPPTLEASLPQEFFTVVYVQYILQLTLASATVLIAFKAWVYWRDVRGSVHRSVSSPGLRALASIIESGIVYLALLVWYGSIEFWGASDSLARWTARYYCVPLIAMYPTLVIAIVGSRRSMQERRSRKSATNIDETRGAPYKPPRGSNGTPYQTQWIYLTFSKDPESMSVVSASKDYESLMTSDDKTGTTVNQPQIPLPPRVVALPRCPEAVYS
ncbi:unnamed protein product [Peniophora sp. CBMAI 1063]|nr:unnamed protein product [Peniophora sp. CBMAI 1063]